MIATKHLCPTCGYKIPHSQNIDTDTDTEVDEGRRPARSYGFWSKLFKWELTARATEKVDSTQEKPVLS